jgi:hypothetical protein
VTYKAYPTAQRLISESVEEIQGVENALDADQGEVEHEVPEDDQPEYLDKDR